MDMNRAASTTLLKDATAKALYTVLKGANGVVVIETVVPEKDGMLFWEPCFNRIWAELWWRMAEVKLRKEQVFIRIHTKSITQKQDE